MDCAHRCPIVQMLIIALARSNGKTVEQQRTDVGLSREYVEV